MKQYNTYFHIRVNDLSEEQLNRFKNNVKDVEWMMIGKIHKGSLQVDHYHVLLKYNCSRLTSTIRNKFILNYKTIGSDSYYCQPKYENSSIEQFVAYVKDKDLVLFYGEEEYIKDITPIPPKKTLKEVKQDLTLTRIEHAKAGDWKWFEDNDIAYTLKNEYEKLRARYFKVNKFSAENRALKIKGNTKLKFFWPYGESRKGKDSWVEFFCKMEKLECFPKSKISPYWNGCKSAPLMQDAVSISEFDGPLKAGQKMEIGLELIKEAFDKCVFPARCAYSFQEVIRFKFGFITSQIHPFDALFPPGSMNVDENWAAINNRFSIIEVSHLPDLFSIDFNVKEEEWELNELSKVPLHIAKKYPHLIDEDGYNIFSKKWYNN